MATFKEIFDYLNTVFPKSDSEPWDTDGIDICLDPSVEINKIVLALDVTSKIADEAEKEGANLIITHHPLIFNKINEIDVSNSTSKRIISLISKGISSISLHTRLDKHQGGVTDSLCKKLGLFVDDKICNGLVNICHVEETSFESFTQKTEKSFGIPIRTFKNNEKVKTIAVCGGGGKSFVDDVVLYGADTYITGEVSHPQLIDAEEYGLNIVLGSHYATEIMVLPFLKNVIEEKFTNIPVVIKYTNGISK